MSLLQGELLTAKEVADHVRVHVDTFRLWCRKGKGPRVTQISGNCQRYALTDVVDWLEARHMQKDCA